MSELINRIQKRLSQRRKWAKRQSITCFRVYHRDIPDFPCAIDYLDGNVVCWLYERKKDDTDEQVQIFETTVKDAVRVAFNGITDKVFFKSRQIQKGIDQQYQKLFNNNIATVVSEGGLQFELNLTDYLDTGLFLDHRQTRALCRDLSKGKRVLNLFAYTGSFTCYAVDGGASATTTVDLNENYVEWAKRNMALNRFQIRETDQFIVDNCLAFIKHEAGRPRYDLIICDPPTFSNSKKMKIPFSVDTDYPDLIRSCLKLLVPGGTLLFSTNSRRFCLDPEILPSAITIQNITSQTIPEDFKGTKSHQCWRLEKG